jgi:uncharacterized protein involved in cysteine biosynthesis
MRDLLEPLVRAIGQLDDRVMVGVLVQSVLASLACFVALYVGAVATVNHFETFSGWLGWVADVVATVGAALAALWLFLPIAAAIGSLFFDRIAAAVEARWYPTLPPARPAAAMAQMWDGIALGGRILLFNLLALVLALLLPGVGLILGWAIAAYAMGRGLFVGVAMRRMPRMAAEALYMRNRPLVLVQGAALAFAGSIPFLNLLIPVVGVAAMVHVLDRALLRAAPAHWRG